MSSKAKSQKSAAPASRGPSTKSKATTGSQKGAAAGAKGKAAAAGGANRNRNRKVMRDSIQRITRPALRRIQRVAGIKTISGLVYEELRGVLKHRLESILKNTTEIAKYLRVKTVKPAHVVEALKQEGVMVVAGLGNLDSMKDTKHPKRKERAEGTKPHRSKPGTAAIREIRRAQKNSDTLVIPYAPFNALVREISQDFMDDLRFSEEAVKAIQLAVEDYLVKMLQEALLCTIHAQRQVLHVEDIQLARRIRGERS